MRFRRFAGAVAAVALAAIGCVGAPAAQDSVCTGLEAELASLEQGPSAESQSSFRQYDAAVARQQRQPRNGFVAHGLVGMDDERERFPHAVGGDHQAVF